MAKGYAPFPVYDFKTGLHLARKPWLLPKDAFQRMLNGYVYRGQIFKRLGYQFWKEPTHAVDDEALDTTVDLTLTYGGTLANTDVKPGSLTITDDGVPHETFTDNGDGTLTGDAGGSGTINYDTGQWSITYNSNPGNGLSITADYNYYPGLPIVGIENFYASTGSQQLCAFNTRRMHTYDPTQGIFVDRTGSDLWTGSEGEYFWCENWQDKLFITNNVDRLRTWDGSTIATPDIEFEGGSPGNQLDTCLLIFAYKGHLLLLRTTESGAVHPQRARWSKAGAPLDFTNDGYVDAPSLDWIMGAEFLGDDLVVLFERSMWILKYTGSPDLPFRWEKVVDTEGSYTTFGVFNFSDEVIAVGPTSLIATDGLDAYGVDQKIPDMVLDINSLGFQHVYAFIAEEMRQAWISYPSIGSDLADSILIMNYEENTWSKFDLGFSCFGYFSQEEDPSWDNIDLIWDEVDWSWDDRKTQAGFPTNLGGGYDGILYTLNESMADNGDPIEFDLLSGDWNPFIEDGRKCRLGWVDMLVDRDPASTNTIEFYANQLPQPVVSQNVTLTDGSNEDHIWIRVFANIEGETVRMRIHQNAANAGIVIHALVPYFKEAGRIGQ